MAAELEIEAKHEDLTADLSWSTTSYVSTLTGFFIFILIGWWNKDKEAHKVLLPYGHFVFSCFKFDCKLVKWIARARVVLHACNDCTSILCGQCSSSLGETSVLQHEQREVWIEKLELKLFGSGHIYVQTFACHGCRAVDALMNS